MTTDEQRAYIAVLAAEAKELHARCYAIRRTHFEKSHQLFIAAQVLDERVAVLTRDLESRK